MLAASVMRRWCACTLVALTISCAVALAPSAGAYEVIGRWNNTVTDGSTGAQGNPITLTWSIVPDGTQVPGEGDGYAPSNLIAFFDNLIGAGPGGSDLTQRPWFALFEQSYQRLSELAGVTFIYEPNDDGRRMEGAASASGLLGVRGDVRIGTSSFFEGSSVLAFNYYPRYGGDMVINPNQGDNFGNPANNYREARNIIMHETMHGLGIAHVESEDADYLIEPYLNSAFDGPQLDDILALQRNYGDRYEKGAGNNTAATATPLGTLIDAPLKIGGLGSSTVVSATDVDFLSIDDDSDTDFFSFSITQRAEVTLDVTPYGASYMVGPQGGTEVPFNSLELNNLTLALIGSNGVTVLASANANGVGLGESLAYELDPGTYYARVRGTLNDIQLYGLSVSLAPASAGTLVWDGSVSNVWNVGGAANFKLNDAPAKFYSGTAVEFDDTATNSNVEVAQNVSPFSTRFTTAGTYNVSGVGGILTGLLTVDGGGEVVLGNTNNQYAGPTTIESGTLRIIGNANEMVTPIEIKAGAKLVLDSVDASFMKSQITIREGAELQVGTETTNTNTLADVHPGIINYGTMRVLDSEQINHVTGTGSIVLEREESTISDNLGYDGPLTIRSGATGRILNAAAFGSNFGATTVEAGGVLAFDGNIVTGEPIAMAGDGGGQGAIRVESGRNVTLSGAVSVSGDAARVQLQAGATLAVQNGLNASATVSPLQLAVGSGSQLNVAGGLNAPGVVKSGAGTAIVSDGVALTGRTDVVAGRLALIGPNQLSSHFDVAAGATLAIGGGHTFSSAARLTGNGVVQGTFNFPGTIAPGTSAGRLSVEGNLALAGKLEIEIGGVAPVTDYDQLQITGAGVLGGSVEVSLINDFAPSFGDSFTILTASKPLSGQFASLALPGLTGGMGWNVSYLSNSVRLSVVSMGLLSPADFNSDGFVNSGDLNIWKSNFGAASGASRSQGDADGDGAVTGSDFLIWQRGGASAATFAAAAVPEPAGWVLAVAGVVLTGCRRSGRS